MTSSLLPSQAASSPPATRPLFLEGSSPVAQPLPKELASSITRLVPAERPQMIRIGSTVGAPTVVIAGSQGGAPAAVLSALLAADDLPLAGAASGPTWVVLRAGSKAKARAYVPGLRRGRVVEPCELDVRAVAARPARRIEVEHPASLLASVGLACAPEIRAGDTAMADLLVDAAHTAAGLVFVTTEAPFELSHLELLARAAERVDRFAFVLARPSGDVNHRQLVATKRAVLAGHAPALAAAAWYTLDELAELRAALVGWGRPHIVLSSVPAGVPRQRDARRAALTVPVEDEHWRDILDKELEARQAVAARAVAENIIAIHASCATELAAERGCAGLPGLLDTELHALSVRTTRRLEADAVDLTTSVCSELLGVVPDQSTRAMAMAAVRRTIEARDETKPPRALLLTTTAGVAAVTGSEALDALAVLRPSTQDESVLAPVGVAVNPSCYDLWQRRDPDGVLRCRPWLARALKVVETTVLGELDLRYGELRHALGVVATDAVDHGFLLV